MHKQSSRVLAAGVGGALAPHLEGRGGGGRHVGVRIIR
jgi:hypothetical protein